MTIKTDKSKFALFFGNRGFFPASHIASARTEMVQVLTDLGYDTLIMDAEATRYGAVETAAEGEIYAKFLRDHEGEYDGVILSLPNFGDENGAVAALKNAGVPIFVQAYPDEIDKMSPALRRDAFCGKMSIMDVFYQNNIKSTVLKPHTVSPASHQFAQSIDHFDRICKVVKRLRNMVVGAIGARTTAFKTVRIDELALQKNGITMETFDLSDIFARVNSVNESSEAYKEKLDVLLKYADFSKAPQDATVKIAKFGVVMDAIVEECKLDAIAVRCWTEMQQILGMSPCVVLSEMNNRNMIAACEVDVGNAIAMSALNAASGDVAACLDWNNNYNDDENKCIFFHCGPVPQSMMACKGTITGHAILQNIVGQDCSYGCNVGRIASMPFTFSSMMTDSGRLKFYLGEGQFTDDYVPADYFGCSAVAEIPNLQDTLINIVRNGHRHHVSVTPGHVAAAAKEALEYYLGFDVTSFN